MLDNILFLSAPITVSILMAGILAYFGNHILTRGIIFIDIAVAQIAALGTMIGLLLGLAEESSGVQLISYAFTIVVIALFALTKFRDQVIPQEAIIGIIYCIGLGLAMLLAERIPGGANFISKTITGNLLWVTWSQVLNCFLLFLAVAIVHLFFRKHFIAISDTKKGLPYSLWKTRSYELIFYITFGIVIVKAVPVGGIFMVFILLIAPAAAATLFTQSWKKRFIWSWIIGIAGSVSGMYASYKLNISNAPAIVSLLSLTVFILAFIKLAAGRFKTDNIKKQ
ncbi:MAG TPA: metal ABC transporter permease [Bacteroidales bacterium]|jgi:zinc/manganese transport system permease protein|nr:metal ABC transporter permease [Bacteroidales bacterium]HQH23218.1 metal ABC transporter permease [Bacteroidales bacterium]HQJ80924.1 metal ABC transporter permease [Bacteroidales bacterium]